jgi:hypothetical protein
MRRSFVRAFPLIAVLAMVSACSDDPTTPTTPTTPSGTITTETFEGTLNKNGATTFNLTIGSSGTVTATLTKVAPDATIALGFSLGTWNGTACSTSGIFNDNALAGATILGSVSAAATLCVRAYDVGKVVDPITFAIEITHP